MRITLDSNILVYVADVDSPSRHRAAKAVLARAVEADCVLTLQSLAEFYWVVTRTCSIAARTAEEFVSAWRYSFPVHAADQQAFHDAFEAVRNHRISFWDALLWATARSAGRRFVLTEDLQDLRTLGGVTFVNPFNPADGRLLASMLGPHPRPQGSPA